MHQLTLLEIIIGRLDLIGLFVPPILLYLYYKFQCIPGPWYATIALVLAAFAFISVCIIVWTQWYFDCPTWLGDCYNFPNDVSILIELMKMYAFWYPSVPFIRTDGMVELTSLASACILFVSFIRQYLRRNDKL